MGASEGAASAPDSGAVEPPVVVFLTNMSADHNYAAAARYGAIRPVTRGNFPVYKHVRLIDEIISALVHSTKEDYLLFSGSAFVASICLSAWLILHRECKALLWDPRQNGYVPRKITRDALVISIEKAKDEINA